MFGFPLKNYTPGICDRPLLQGRKNPPKHGPNSRIRDIWFQVDLDTYIYIYTHEVLPYIHTYHICIPISIHACKYTSFIIYIYTLWSITSIIPPHHDATEIPNVPHPFEGNTRDPTVGRFKCTCNPWVTRLPSWWLVYRVSPRIKKTNGPMGSYFLIFSLAKILIAFRRWQGRHIIISVFRFCWRNSIPSLWYKYFHLWHCVIQRIW